VEKFPSNWELSAVRATNVVKFLTEKVGVDPNLVSAAAYSMHRPIASNDTKGGRAQNRRIEIALLPLNLDRVLKDLR
jgi:chemotaxis protein MotB